MLSKEGGGISKKEKGGERCLWERGQQAKRTKQKMHCQKRLGEEEQGGEEVVAALLENEKKMERSM